MSFVSAASSRPRGVTPFDCGLRSRLFVAPGLAVAVSLACLTSDSWATTLTVNQVKATHATGALLPVGFPVAITADASPSAESATMTGSVGPVTRGEWTAAGISTLRLQFSGSVLDGVAAGSEVNFSFGMLVSVSRGSVIWSARGSANVPPSQGFIDGPNGSVHSTSEQPTLVTGSFGRSFIFNSTADGAYSFHIDFSWQNAFIPPETMSVEILYATVHLPAPGVTAFGMGIAGFAARRRRPAAG